jgi:predicted lipoprotein with Yx(FWY)xxD motif
MKRALLITASASLTVALMGSLAAIGQATASGTKIGMHKTSIGKILVAPNGFTLYAFTRDTRNKDTCQNITSCPDIWSAMVSSGKPVAGTGVKQSLLGTITLKNGKHQVTYNGHPLYKYVDDSSPHDISYAGFREFGGKWQAVNTAGKPVQ